MTFLNIFKFNFEIYQTALIQILIALSPLLINEII